LIIHDVAGPWKFSNGCDEADLPQHKLLLIIGKNICPDIPRIRNGGSENGMEVDQSMMW
jgi:hypothetical protein